MAKNQNLHKAKDAKKDECYTQYEDIQSERNHYTSHFENKTMLFNSDAPFERCFFKYFSKM